VIIDIPPCSLRLGVLPAPPPGYRIANVDITIRLKRIDACDDPISAGHDEAGSACSGCGQCALGGRNCK